MTCHSTSARPTSVSVVSVVDGELLDMGQRTGRCCFYLLNAVYGKEPFLHQLLPGLLSSRRSALCVRLSLSSLESLSVNISTTVDGKDVRLTTGVSSLNPVQRDILLHRHSQLSDLTIRLYTTTFLKSISQKR